MEEDADALALWAKCARGNILPQLVARFKVGDKVEGDFEGKGRTESVEKIRFNRFRIGLNLCEPNR